MRKRILAFAMSAAMLFTAAGCNGRSASKPETTKGRYIEEILTTSSTPSSMGRLFEKDGRIAFLAPDDEKLFTENDDKTGFDMNSINGFPIEGGRVAVNEAVMANDGSCFISYYDFDIQDDCMYALISPTGEFRKLTIPYLFMETCVYTPDDRLFAFAGNKVVEVDTAQQTTKELFDIGKEICGYDLVNDYLVVVTNKEMYFYDYKKNRMAETPEAMQNFLKEQGLSGGSMNFKYAFCSGEDGAFYIATEKGLYRYVMNGNQVEQLIDGATCHLGNPSYHIGSVIREADGSFLIAYRECTIIRYRYDAEAINEINATLRIYSLTKNDSLSQAISEYKTMYPNVRVEYEVGMQSGVTYDDALKNLTTGILSGSPPDVMMLDGLDVDNYVDKKMLVDLQEYESVFNPENSLLEQVAKQTRKDGWYTVACKFDLPVLVGKQEDLAKIKDLQSFADYVKQVRASDATRRIACMYNAEETLRTALSMIGNEVVTPNGVDNDALLSMITLCKEIYACERPAYSEEFISHQLDTQTNYEACDRWGTQVPGISAAILCDDYKIALGNLHSFQLGLNLITSIKDQNADLTYRVGFADKSTSFTPLCNLGICASGKNKEDAAQFLAVALSERVQSIELYDGFPVNTKSLQTFYNKAASPSTGIGIAGENGDVIFRAEWIDANEAATFQQQLDCLSTPILIDQMTMDCILENGIRCLEGNCSPQQAVDDITAKLSLRMKE